MPGRLLTLYHHTSNAAAAAILRDRSMISAAPVDLPFAFFSTHREGRAAGPLNYGEAAAAALAAFSYWVAGDGLSARAALEQIPPTQQYSMGQLITVAVRNGLDPKAFPMPHDMPPDVVAGVPAPSSGSEQARRQPPTPASTSPSPGVSR